MLKYEKWIKRNVHRNYYNKTILITGGNSGIGFEATRYFAYLGANIVWLNRSKERSENAKKEILNEFPNAKILIFIADLSDLDSISKCIDEIKEIDIDIVYHNAGVFRIPCGKTKQNFELVLGTNLIGTYVLNEMLLSHLKHKTEIILTTSITAHFNKIDYSDLFFENKSYKNFKAYGSSKRGIVHYFNYLINNYNDYKFYLVHPGITYTPLINKAYKSKVFVWLAKTFMKIVFHSSEKAALEVIFALEKQRSGSYYGPRGLFAISGFPKERKLSKKLTKDSEKTISFLNGLDLIK